MTQFKFLHMISQFQYIFPKLLLKCSNRRAPFPGYRTVFRPDRPNSRNQLWLIPDADVKACKFSQQPTNCARYAKENWFSIAATGECRPSLSAAVSQSEPTVAPVGGANAQSAARGHGTLCCFAQLCLLSSPSRRQKLPQQVFVRLRALMVTTHCETMSDFVRVRNCFSFVWKFWELAFVISSACWGWCPPWQDSDENFIKPARVALLLQVDGAWGQSCGVWEWVAIQQL